MPIKAKRDVVCSKCGKKFTVVLNDAIMPKDAGKVINPLCRICSFKNKLKKS